MQDSISVTVPNTEEALECAATFLTDMACVKRVSGHPPAAQTSVPVPAPRAVTDDPITDSVPINPPAPAAQTPPPPAPPAPAAHTPPPPAAQTDLDTRGVPWDDRIHSSGRTKYKDAKRIGQWKLKKNLDPNYVVQIEALIVTPPAPAAQTPPPPAPPAPPAPAPVPAEITTAQEFFPAYKIALDEGRFTTEQAVGICLANGVENISLLYTSGVPAIPAIAAQLGLTPPLGLTA